jgi:hypothetical protein
MKRAVRGNLTRIRGGATLKRAVVPTKSHFQLISQLVDRRVNYSVDSTLLIQLFGK